MTTVDRPTSQGWVADDSTFGARLALIRQHMRWGNVKEAAMACGLPPESWRSWERDGRAPQRLVEIAGIIADRTGCDFGWLVAGQRLNRSVSGDFNPRLTQISRKVDPKPVRHVTRQPFVQPRRDPTSRPPAVPLTQRRPREGRPSNRPMAVAS